jgi:hypothetical protein
MNIMTDKKKQEEWYQWGKEGCKSARNMMRRNSHHPDYDTPEKREAQMDSYRGWMLDPDRLKTRFKYDDEDCAEAERQYKAGFNASRKWYAKADLKHQAVLDKYMPIFVAAQIEGDAIDMSDIKDGFPCGSAHLYLQKYPETEDLYKALGHFNSDSAGSEAFERQIPVRCKVAAQCIAFDQRFCSVVTDYLQKRGIFVSTHTWID